MKRRYLSIWIVAILSMLCICACKKNVGTPEDNASAQTGESGDENEEEAEETGYKIGFSGINMENPYFITLESAIKEEFDKKEYTLITKDPGSNSELQAEQIKEMIEEGIRAIILSPVDWEKITPSLKALKEADVKIINVDTQVKEMGYVDAYVGSDNLSAGRICGEALIEECPEGGKIAILECPTQNSINDRITGFEEAIAKAQKGFEVVEREDTGGEFERALEEAKIILEKHPDIVAFMCGNDQIAVGAITAVNVAKLDYIKVYGVDGSPDIKKELQKKNSQVAGTAAQSPIHIGQKAAQITEAILGGKDYEKETYEEVFMINKENVEMYGADGWQ